MQGLYNAEKEELKSLKTQNVRKMLMKHTEAQANRANRPQTGIAPGPLPFSPPPPMIRQPAKQTTYLRHLVTVFHFQPPLPPLAAVKVCLVASAVSTRVRLLLGNSFLSFATRNMHNVGLSPLPLLSQDFVYIFIWHRPRTWYHKAACVHPIC